MNNKLIILLILSLLSLSLKAQDSFDKVSDELSSTFKYDRRDYIEEESSNYKNIYVFKTDKFKVNESEIEINAIRENLLIFKSLNNKITYYDFWITEYRNIYGLSKFEIIIVFYTI
jgi:hypothetical protein